MKNYFRYLFIGIFIILLFPLMPNAATFELRKTDTSSRKNIVTYDVIYKLEETDEKTGTYILEMYKRNEDLSYSIDSNYKTENCTMNSCPLVFASLNTGDNVIATITVTNNTETDITTSLKITGTEAESEFTVKANNFSTTTTTTTTTTQAPLNTDASLSNINISVGTMDQAFNKDLTTYNITGIKDTVNSITITPNCDNNCSWEISCPTGECSVSNSRRISLQTGANKVSIIVRSEDNNNSKTYVLNVYRGEIEASSAYLSSIKINGATLSPLFDSMTNDYTTTIGLDVEKLDITTVAEDPKANIVIKGNEKLIEGENTITITVTSSDGENKQVYTIIATKENIENAIEEKEQTEDNEIVTNKVEKKKNNTILIIILSILGLGLIIVVFLLIFKKKKKNNKNNNNNKNGHLKNNEDKNTTKENTSDENLIEKQNTETLNILDETRRQLKEEPKQDIDAALDDLMQTKRLELGDLDF